MSVASEAERRACQAMLADAGAKSSGAAEIGDDVTVDVVVLADTGDTEQALALAEQVAAAGPRLVVARVRSAQGGPLDTLENVVFVDANPIRRQGLQRAVAVAVGRASPEIEADIDLTALPRREPPTPEEALARGELILLAEDNVTNQDVIRRQLAALGFACDIAEDGEVALAAWRDKPYALLLTDCHMPNMDGFELTAAIRADEIDRPDRARIVAITASALQTEVERCYASGMDDFLAKPVAMSALKATLAKWMPEGSGIEAESVGASPDEPRCESAVVDPVFLRDSFGDHLTHRGDPARLCGTGA
ncbi:MAG: response regulator [Alphaproteobacteria bacterium]|nr:response regulator [Alphaproteobacteria bacterium]